MNKPVEIGKDERGAIRVFAINQPPPEVTDALATMPKADLARQLLNSPHLNTASTEIFPVSDLTGMGLSAYLSEGYAVEDAAFSADRGKLDALEGYVLLLFSDSFKGMEATLIPTSALTLIGTYAEYKPAAGGPAIDTDSAKPFSGGAITTPPKPTRGTTGSAVVVVIIILMLGLGLWWLLT